ncbi:HNH endonuclease signature motif containing protein [Streptomyces sp. NPDC047967]|uniref:HNH endonuclease n=1 Tax=Streptomyces sp. NPDC047967 TaxID=3154924 RepID=UPI0033F3812E
MPRAASVCYIRGCTRRTVRSGRCGQHAPPAPKPWSTKSARNTTRSSEWERKTRPRALVLACFACQACGSRERLEVDHIVPVARGGSWTLDNAQVLCQPCHKAKTARDRAG